MVTIAKTKPTMATMMTTMARYQTTVGIPRSTHSCVDISSLIRGPSDKCRGGGGISERVS